MLVERQQQTTYRHEHRLTPPLYIVLSHLYSWSTGRAEYMHLQQQQLNKKQEHLSLIDQPGPNRPTPSIKPATRMTMAIFLDRRN